MKWHVFVSILPCLAGSVRGFPAYGDELVNADAAASHLSKHLAHALKGAHSKRLLSDPENTPIDVGGEHKFIPPDFDNGAQRGPCPALNALANHGYINRNGVTSLLEVTEAINSVFGMGLDLGGILATLGTVFVGNPISLEPGFSIGATSDESENILGNLLGLLGTPRGLNGSHNIIEGDSSNTRADLYMTGDASTMVMSQFESLYNMSSGEGDYNFKLFAKRASIRYHESVATNPNFYYGPWTGLIARNAGYLFASRLFANYSDAHPDGLMTKETLKSMFAVTGTEGNLTYNRGWERIPENWYRIPNDYSIISFNLDLLALIGEYPELANIGGNMGKVNSFAGVDLGDVTGGVLNLTQLLEGNNLLCFVFQIVKTVTPNFLSTIFSILEEPLRLITSTLDPVLLNLSCPAFNDLTVGGQNFDEGILQKYPGANMAQAVL